MISLIISAVTLYFFNKSLRILALSSISEKAVNFHKLPFKSNSSFPHVLTSSIKLFSKEAGNIVVIFMSLEIFSAIDTAVAVLPVPNP